MNLFDTGKVLKHRKLHPPKLSVLRDYKFYLNIVIPSRQIQKNVSEITIIVKHRSVPLWTFAPEWDEKIPTESSEIPFLCRKFFDTRVLLKHWKAIYLFLWYCETEYFWLKKAISPPMHEVYRNRIFYKQRRGPTRIFPVLTGKGVPTEKRNITLVGVNIFDTGKLLKHRNVHLLKFSVLREKNFHRKILISSANIQKFFRYQKISQIQKCSSTTFFTKMRQKSSDRKS